jgi:hypothetical protein
MLPIQDIHQLLKSAQKCLDDDWSPSGAPTIGRRAVYPTIFSSFFLLSLGVAVIYIFTHTHTHTHTYIYKDIGKLMPLQPCAPVSPATVSWSCRALVRHAAPPQWGASSIDHHDCVFSGERHCVTPTRVFTELCTPGEGPQDHETICHVTIFELVLDGVCMV